jgi:predicted translin family RNA/ssDNA-binding protein
MNKETIYIDAVTKLNEQDAVIKELAELLERVLFAWGMRRTLSEENELYVEAADYLKGLRDE